MPSLQDVIEMAELLKVKSIGIEEDKCVRVRNRNSTCNKCVDACIRDAITTGKNELTIDVSVCVNCGCCIAVCPNEVLHALEPTLSHVASDVSKRGNMQTGLLVFACSRKASKHEGNPDSFVELPCLGHLGEELLLKCVSAGLDDIVLVDGDCSSCKYGAANSRINETVENAVALLEATESDAMIFRTNQFPEEVKAEHSKKRSIRGEDRRGILAQTGSYVGHVAMNVAQKTVDEKLGSKDKPKTLHDRLNAGLSGRMPTFEPQRNFHILEDMETLSINKDHPTIDTRHFGNVVIDAEKCSGCGLCVLFCPTAALNHNYFDKPESDQHQFLDFDTNTCTQCKLCEDVCIRKCLTVESEVEVEDLYDFEPKLIEIPKPQARTSILDYNKNRASQK